MFPGTDTSVNDAWCSASLPSVPRVGVERSRKGYADRLRAYEVILDGTRVGRVKRGETLLFDTTAGAHELYLKIDWCRSKTVMLDLKDGEELCLRCWPASKAFWITVGRSRYIGVETVSGPRRSDLARLP